MIQMDIPAHRRLKSTYFANLTLQWIARTIFLASAFVAFPSTSARTMTVMALVLFDTAKAFLFAAIIEKSDEQSLKIWADHLTWRIAFNDIRCNPDKDWPDVIRDASLAALADIAAAQDESAVTGKGTSYWITVPLKVVGGMLVILFEAAFGLFLAELFGR